jgi:hypothetical protein
MAFLRGHCAHRTCGDIIENGERQIQTYVLESIPTDWYPSVDPRSEAGKIVFRLRTPILTFRLIASLNFAISSDGIQGLP